jgi:hypothetical protein
MQACRRRSAGKMDGGKGKEGRKEKWVYVNDFYWL